MNLKYYLKGLGTGILFASIILSISFAVYDKKAAAKRREDIIEAAIAEGMVWPEKTSGSENSTNGSSSDDKTDFPENTASDATEGTTGSIATKDTDSKKNENSGEANSTEEMTPEETDLTEPITPEETDLTGPTTPEDTDLTEPTTSEETDLTEPTTPEETDLTEPTTPEESETQSDNTEENLQKETNSGNENKKGIIVSENDESAVIKIVKGMNSYGVAKLLESAGIIENGKEFDSYVINKGNATRIRVGTYELKKGLSYEEIMNSICRLK